MNIIGGAVEAAEELRYWRERACAAEKVLEPVLTERDQWRTQAVEAGIAASEMKAELAAKKAAEAGWHAEGTSRDQLLERVKELEADCDRLAVHSSGQSKAIDELAAVADRWKARAEKAEVKVSELECELYAARSIPRQTVADLQLKAELQQALEAAEKRVKELETKLALAEKERDEAKETVGSIQEDYSELESERNRLNRRVQELERQLSSRPSTLEAVLEELREELRGEGIPGSIHVDRYGIHVSVYCVEGLHHTESVQSFHDIPAAMAELVVMHYPDSAFARRRKPAEPTPNSSETPNSSTDELGNRYRRIVDAVDRYFANGCSSNNAFADEVTRIVYPKEAAK